MILLIKFYEGLQKLVRVEVRGGVQRAEEVMMGKFESRVGWDRRDYGNFGVLEAMVSKFSIFIKRKLQ